MEAFLNNNFYKDKRVLVAGASGFIGKNLVLSLKKMGAIVKGSYLNNKPNLELEDVEFVKCDFTSSSDCLSATQDIEYVFMCSANSSGALVMEKTPLVHLTPNVIMNALILEASYINKVKKFCFISSNTVYPVTENAVKEDDAKYEFFEKYFIVGWMKQFSELMCNMYSQKIKTPMETLIIRPGNLYGPFDKFTWKESKVIAALIRRSIEKQNPFKVWGDGSDIKDFLYIDDFIEGMLMAFSSLESNEIINIASGKPISIKDIIYKVLDISNHSQVKIEFDKTKPTMIPKRLIDISKIKSKTNWQPKTSIEDGLANTISWYRSYYLNKSPEDLYDN